MGRIDVRGIRRKQILDATKRLVVEKGWTDVSILDICHAAGISSGVITYHFQNKDEIMFALLEEILDQIEALSYRAVQGTYTPEEDISTFLTILTSLQEADPNFPSLLIELVAASLHRPEIAQRLQVLFQKARQQKVEEWKALGVVDRQGDDGLVLVSMLHSVILGVMLGGPFMGIDMPRERQIRETKRILLACFPPSFPTSEELTRNKSNDL